MEFKVLDSCSCCEVVNEDNFINLHLHTAFSLLDGMSKPEDVAAKVKKLGQKGFAVTEHGNVHSSVKMYKLAKENGLKFIYGVEFYICDDRFEKDKTKKYYHLTVLAKNEQGRQNINKLTTLGYLEGFYFKPRIDFDLLTQHKEGLIVMSGCMASELQQALAGGKIGNGDIEITSGNIERGKEIAKRYFETFGSDYYLEVQSHRDSRQQQLNRAIVDIGNDMGIKYVATADSHFVNEDDLELHKIFIAIARNKDDYEADETYLDTQIQSEKEAWNLLKSLSEIERNEAIRNTMVILEKCTASLPLSAALIPEVKVPLGFETQADFLKELCNKGWVFRKINRKDKRLIEKYKERLMYEFNAIVEMGFEGYYLLVYGYANSVERRGIARGSGGGSLVAYLLNIVDIDPIEHGLYFERFIDVAQLDLLRDGVITREELKIPDFDLDFAPEERDLIVQNIVEEHGQEHVAALGQFGYIWSKSAIKDVGRVMGVPFDVTNAITKALDDDTIDGAILSNNHAIIQYERLHPKLFEYARKLEGLPRSYGVHPCFTEGHLVMTNKGYKEIQEIKNGDVVLTHNNRFMNVVNTTKNVSNNLMSLKIMGSESITTTENHPFYAKERKDKRKKIYGSPIWKNACELSKGDMIGIAINSNSLIPKLDNLPSNDKDFWWMIGRYIGDGWTFERMNGHKEYRVIICDDKFSNKVSQMEDKIKSMFKCTIMKDKTTDKLCIDHKSLFDYVNSFGKYAHGKRLTQDIFNLPVDYLEKFLDGYFESDGYIDKQGYQTVKTVSKELAFGIQACIHKVYNTICSMSTMPPQQETIEGRMVNSKKRYLLSFKKHTSKKDRSFFENGYIWTPFKDSEQINGDHEVYNFSVLDDNSYTINNMIVHNCGKVVTIDKAVYYTGLSASKDGEMVLQIDMKDAEALGLVKIDVLGLRTISVIYDTLQMIGKNVEYIRNLNYGDLEVLSVFRGGFTDGIFQFESEGMKNTMKNMQPTGIDDLSAVNALYRPGSMKYIDNYIARMHGMEKFEYLHPDLEEILGVTYGIIVFQEQLISIGRLAGMRNPDLIRQATGKKDAKKMAKAEPEMRSGLYARGWTKEQVDTLWEIMLEFSKYSFNKAHSQAYAIIAFICAFLKKNHPLEFMCAWLNSLEGKDNEKFETAYKEAKRMNIKFNKPTFRNALPLCQVEKGGLTYGLSLIKHCNRQMGDELQKLSWNKYAFFVDLLIDIKETTSINSKQLDILIHLGYFSEFGNPERLIGIVEEFSNGKTRYSKTHKDATKVKRIQGLHEYEKTLPKIYSNVIFPMDTILFEKEHYGFIKSVFPEMEKRVVGVLNIDMTYTPKVDCYIFKTGETFQFKVKKDKFFGRKDIEAFDVGDMIKVIKLSERNKMKKVDEKWVETDQTEHYLESCSRFRLTK